jgi:inhibitor of cysteine peptidase
MRVPIFAVYLDTRKLASYVVLAFIIGGFLGGVMWNYGGVYIPRPVRNAQLDFGNMNQFSSYDELKGFLESRIGAESSSEPVGQASGVDVLTETSNSATSAADAASTAADSALAAANDAKASAAEAAAAGGVVFDELGGFVVSVSGRGYSETNVQVEGVDEADLVKTDGQYIYLTRNGKVYIVRAYPPEAAEVVSMFQPDQQVQDLYVDGDKLVLYLRMSKAIYRDMKGKGFPVPEDLVSTTTIQVYDISNRGTPELEREVTVEGDYVNSRLIGDYVYTVTRKRAKVIDDEVDLPSVETGGSNCSVEASEVYYMNYTDNRYYFTTIIAFNMQDPGEPESMETMLLGRASSLYVSYGSIYIATCRSDTTVLHRIRIDEGEIAYVAEGSVPGYVLNQFSMDENGGYFRIATTSRRNGKSSNVYVLDGDLEIVGWLEGLAPGEDIYSARFMGDRCYMVTFKKVDPLFTIDLSDPENPKVLGKLKIPGYSDYLHPYDEDTLIGLGKDTVDAEGESFAWYQGVKISLFDVSNVHNPRELAKLVIGERGSESPALDDHRAFLFSRARNLLVIPIYEENVGIVSEGELGRYYTQGAYVFHISEAGIILRGMITHADGGVFKAFGDPFNSDYEVQRALYIEEVLYTISNAMIKMSSLTDLEELGTVDLF